MTRVSDYPVCVLVCVWRVRWYINMPVDHRASDISLLDELCYFNPLVRSDSFMDHLKKCEMLSIISISE